MTVYNSVNPKRSIEEGLAADQHERNDEALRATGGRVVDWKDSDKQLQIPEDLAELGFNEEKWRKSMARDKDEARFEEFRVKIAKRGGSIQLN